MFDYSIVGYLMGKTPVIENQETEPLNKDDQDEEESKDETENIVSDKVSFLFKIALITSILDRSHFLLIDFIN